MKVSYLPTFFLFAGVMLAQVPQPPAPAKPGAAPPAAAAAPAVPVGDAVVITIGSEKITANEFNGFIESLPEQYRAQAQGPMKRQMAEQIASMRVLANEARRRKLDQEQALQNRIKLQTENLLAGAAMNEMMKSTPINDASVQKYFSEHKGDYEQVKASHILIRMKGSPVPLKEGQKDLTDEEALAKAQAVRKRLAAGEDFSAVAKTESDDVGSGAQGGDLGQFKRGSMVPAFDEAAFKLPAGQISEPVKTQFGYHLIRVDAHDSRKVEDVRAEIEGRLKPEMAQKAVEELKAKTAITYNEAFFGPSAAAPAPAPVKGAIATP